MKQIFFLLILSTALMGCYTPIKVRNLETNATDIVEVSNDFVDLLVAGDTMIFHEKNSDLRPSDAFVGVILGESMAVTLDNSVNPITGDTILAGTILPCVAKDNRKTGDIVFLVPMDGDLYTETANDGIRAVFIK